MKNNSDEIIEVVTPLQRKKKNYCCQFSTFYILSLLGFKIKHLKVWTSLLY